MKPNAPNILFLFSDEHGFRYMNHVPHEEGGEPVYTPNFDKLAAQGTVFTNTYCQMPLCTPSRLCTFTGREVRGAGAWANTVVLRPELPTIGETLEQAGYETCLSGKYHLGGNNQHGGFMHRPYGDLTGACGHQWEPIGDPDRKSMRARTALAGETTIPEGLMQENMVNAEALSFLRELRHSDPEKPWFLTASYSRPHFPLNAPKRHFDRYWPEGVTEPKVPPTGDAYNHPMSAGMRKGFKVDDIDHNEMMRARAAYFANVTYLDELIGDFLADLEREGFLENTIIVYSTDHGEMAGEHGVWWKNGWYEACTHIPFIFSLPDQRKGKMAPQKLTTPVRLIDLYPTLCGLTGITPPNNLDGADLSHALLGAGEKAIPAEKPVFCDSLIPRWGVGTEFRMIRLGDYKYVVFRNADPLLFNLRTDPGEQQNLIDSEAAEDRSARESMAALAKESMDFDAAEKERMVRDGKLKEQYPFMLDTKDGLNQFILPDGRVVEADDTLYRPRVLAERAQDVFMGRGR
jgi:choline-sulfatase